MKKMIIGKVLKEKIGDNCFLKTIIKRDNCEDFELVYTYNSINLEDIDDRFADPFLISLLPYAMEFGFDIRCENPVSTDIYYNLVNDIIPTLSKYIRYFNSIKLEVNGIMENKSDIIRKGVATGCSCGVDSLHAIYTNSIEGYYSPRETLLTDLVVVNSGACSWEGGEKSHKWFVTEIDRAKRVAQELNLGLITIDTNLMEFYKCDHAHSGYSRICGTLLAIKKIVQRYFFASGYEISKTKFSTIEDAYYAAFLLNEYSDSNLKFQLSGVVEDRYDKVKIIEDFDVAHKYLNVCWDGGNNCGHCEKCLRTIGAFYARNKLEKFDTILNTRYFRKKTIRCIAKMIYYKSIHKDLYSFLKDIKKQHFFKYWVAFNYSVLIFYPVYTIIRITKKILKINPTFYNKLKNRFHN